MNRPKVARNPRQLQFVTSAVNMQGCPADDMPEVAIVGRSNAGKSSLINGLAKARIAQISSTPGKTRLLNFYVSPNYRLVDMPGYGFSARSGDEQSSWQNMIEPYLSQRENLVGLLIVMDIRRPWSEDEQNLLHWIEPRGVSSAIILTKADKMTRSDIVNTIRKIRAQSGIDDIVATSALKKIGFEELEDLVFRKWIRAEDVPESDGGDDDDNDDDAAE